jgi:hypothetical protein
MRRTSLPSLIGRVGATICASTFLVAALGSTPASASAANRSPTINTYRHWNGSRFIFPFGCPDTTTYGQVIKVPGNKSNLQKFSFWWSNYSGSGSMVVRGEVYAWEGGRATGPSLFESAPQTISFGDASFHKVVFKPGGISVTPHAKYVIFASIDKDYEQCTGDYAVDWASVSDAVYPKGTFVYQNNEGDESQWTTRRWDDYGIDLAVKVYMGH